jgi:hypothetical protein
MFGAEQIFAILNVAAIQAKVDAYGSAYAIWNDVLIPQDFTGTKSINFYMQATPTETEVDIYSYSINCRAQTMNEAQDIANTIINTINRKSNSDCFVYLQPLMVIPPMDDTDNYNAALDVVLKKRI